MNIGSVESSPAQSKQDIKEVKRWEQARAVYLSDLDNSTLDFKQNVPEDYSSLRDLIEAKYQLALAEGQLVVPNFYKQAIADLKQAQSFLLHAINHADAKDQESFSRIKGKVDHILQFITHGGGCWSEKLSAAFGSVDYDIEKILHRS